MAKRVEVIKMSEYDSGITEPSLGTQWTLNGGLNANFKTYQDAFDDSPTNAFIIKTIVNYVMGDGLIDKSGTIDPHAYLSKDHLRLICLDFKIHGSVFPQIINRDRKPVKIKHTPVYRVGLGIDQNANNDTFMDVIEYWWSWDFKDYYKYPPKPVPMFQDSENDNLIEMMHIKTISSQPYYPFPDWFSGLKAARIESALMDDTINHIRNGFQGKTIININNAKAILDDEVESIKKQIKDEYTGTENSDGLILSVNESIEDALIVDTIEPRGRNEQYVTYDETSEIKLMAAHQALNILFQRPGSSGFSNNADEIATATDSLYLGVINPMREILLDSLNRIFKKIDNSVDLDFINFKQEKAIVNDGADDDGIISEDELGTVSDEEVASRFGEFGVGGVQGILSIQQAVSQGQSDYESAVSVLNIIYGFEDSVARKILGEKKINNDGTVN